MVLRKVRDAADAAGCLAAATASGLGRADWARANGVNARSLNAWRLILARRRGGSDAGTLRLVELVTNQGDGRAAIVVRCGPFAIELDSDFDEHALARLLAVVASC